ncbi:YHYH protein [Cyclobacteriaceae bacterium]|nr:YHYH protein [Cyclobacteriaceae bacterium]
MSFYFGFSQEPILSAWHYNTTNKKASYYSTSGSLQNPVFTLVDDTDIDADILEVAYDDDWIYVRSDGMTDNMGQFQNAGSPSAQGYVWKFPRNPVEATVKEEVNITFAVGVLTNGIPIFGNGDGKAWDGMAQANGNVQNGYWNGNAYYSEGFTLDTAFAAHPQQDGAYHTHATPYRLYDGTGNSGHSPIVGFAHDGFPIYGPFGYSTADDASSAVQRMESGYSLRNISERNTFAGSTTPLRPEERGPDVSVDHPLGEYIEDYEYLEGQGDLDEHNGRFCVTPDYPNGTYAYFVTTDQNGDPAFPYYIGATYYGNGVDENNSATSQVDFPTSGVTTADPDNLPTALSSANTLIALSFFPNPANDQVQIKVEGASKIQMISIISQEGRMISNTNGNGQNEISVNVSNLVTGTYYISILTEQGVQTQKLIVGAQ